MRQRNPWGMALAVVFLIAAMLACGPGPRGEGPSITITSPASGIAVTVGEEVQIVSTAAADAGVARVELSINGQVVRSDVPPSGNPTTFSVVQVWTPMAEGEVMVSVIAYDTEEAASEPATITLRVEAAVAEVTPTPEADVAGPGGCTLNASYVADVTVPDDTELASGTAFIKTWRLRNTGTCDWGPGFSLVFVGGDQMGGSASVSVPATAAGSTADVSVNLVAPGEPGTYRGNWRMQSDAGLLFGSTVYVRIVVPAPATVTPTPTEEPTLSGPTNLQVALQADGSALFTWNDAVGETEYRYEFSFVAGGLGVAHSESLPAETTSWNSGVLDCGGNGGFTIIALAEDGSEIGRLTVNFDTPACAEETVILSPIASRSGNMSTEGCSGLLRAGIAPAGNYIRGFVSFDISGLHDVTIVAASLDMSDYSLTDDPFDLQPLHIEQVQFDGSLCSNPDNLSAPTLASLGEISAESGLESPLNVKTALADYLGSGSHDYFQVRMRWDDEGAGSGSASMLNWSTVRLIVVYQP